MTVCTTRKISIKQKYTLAG